MRVRGLKHKGRSQPREKPTVAPHAGAWIETIFEHGQRCYIIVAPHAGAWIETTRSMSDADTA